MGQQGSAAAGGGGGGGGGRIEDKYFLQKVKLGQGSFGTVWRGVDRTNDRVVAIKQLDKATMPKRQVSRKDIEREVELMKAVKHENVTTLYDTYEDDRSIYLALEYCDGGDFGDKVQERGMGLKEEEAADWMQQICSAILALHGRGIIHRDIKPDNFMVAVTTLKLSDFGLACFLPRGKLLTDKCGTPAFMAPEQKTLPSKSRGYSFPCDMWAAGISMYMLMFGGKHPFLTANNQLDDNRLLQGQLDFREGGPSGGFFEGVFGGQKQNLRFSQQARQICSRMVTPDPGKRITAEDALRDAWLASAIRRKPSGGAALQGAATPQAAAQQRQPGRAVPEAAVFPTRQNPARATTDLAQLQMQQKMQAEKEEAQRRITQLEQKAGALEQKNAKLQNALVSAKAAQVQQKPGPLRTGLRCRYFSPSYGWMAGTVQGMNEQDGTYNLDVRQHAAPDKIAPPDSVSTVDDMWPPGTWVFYESSSIGSMLPGIITGFNQNDGTYNLDLREHAAVDRIRARIGDSSPPLQQQPGDGGYRPEGMHTEKAAPQGAADFDGNVPAPPPVPVSEGANAGYGYGQQPSQGRASSSPLQRPPDGSKCMVLEQQGPCPAIIEGYNQTDGSYSVLVDPGNARRRQMVGAESIRAPGKESHAWPQGTAVYYESASLGYMVPAAIISFDATSGTYNLDVREHAAPERVRPR